jgi:hypothetical protein
MTGVCHGSCGGATVSLYGTLRLVVLVIVALTSAVILVVAVAVVLVPVVEAHCSTGVHACMQAQIACMNRLQRGALQA